MQQLPKEAYDQLKELFKQKYNEELTDDECVTEAQTLLYISAFSKGKLHLLHHFIDSN